MYLKLAERARVEECHALSTGMVLRLPMLMDVVVAYAFDQVLRYVFEPVDYLHSTLALTLTVINRNPTPMSL